MINDIKNLKNEKELFTYIGKFELLNHIKSIEDLIIRKKIDASKEILSYSKFDFFIYFGREERRKKLFQIIAKLFEEKIEDINKLYSDLESECKKVSKKKIINDFFNSIKRFEGIFSKEGFNFDTHFYNEYTLLNNLFPHFFLTLENQYWYS